MKAKKDKHPVVLVVWIDAHSEQIWAAAKELDDKMTPVTSIGWLVKEMDKSIYG